MLFRPFIRLVFVSITIALLVGCGAETPRSTEETAAQETPAQSGGDTSAAQPTPPASSGFEPVRASDDQAGDAGLIDAPGATFRMPATWQSEPPANSMRLAQAIIPGDGGEGQLTVFYFGPGGGGGVDANLERWVGQVEASSPPTRETATIGPFTITSTEVAGTILPSTMGVGPTEPQPDSLLLGAVVEGPGGPWFFKATGPAATLDAARDDFMAMLESAQVAP